jgi:hypothetical protein
VPEIPGRRERPLLLFLRGGAGHAGATSAPFSKLANQRGTV